MKYKGTVLPSRFPAPQREPNSSSLSPISRSSRSPSRAPQRRSLLFDVTNTLFLGLPWPWPWLSKAEDSESAWHSTRTVGPHLHTSTLTLSPATGQDLKSRRLGKCVPVTRSRAQRGKLSRPGFSLLLNRRYYTSLSEKQSQLSSHHSVSVWDMRAQVFKLWRKKSLQ